MLWPGKYIQCVKYPPVCRAYSIECSEHLVDEQVHTWLFTFIRKRRKDRRRETAVPGTHCPLTRTKGSYTGYKYLY